MNSFLHIVVYVCFLVEIVLIFVLADVIARKKKYDRKMASYRRRSTDSCLYELALKRAVKKGEDNMFFKEQAE